MKGQVAIVTGGSRGIGKAIALELAQKGATVVISYVGNKVAAEETVEQCMTLGGQCVAVQGDIASSSDCDALIDYTLKTFGQIDFLVNNAGITKDGLTMKMSNEDFDAVIDTNLKGAFYMMRGVTRPMMKKRKGSIVNLSSVVGLMGNAGQINYAASKAGIIGMTKSLARELAARGITVNAVAPGFISTDMTAVLSEEMKSRIKTTIPLGSLGESTDVAKAVVFLLESRYITGQVVAVDGGMSMM